VIIAIIENYILKIKNKAHYNNQLSAQFKITIQLYYLIKELYYDLKMDEYLTKI
jgi:hypothetical protein